MTARALTTKYIENLKPDPNKRLEIPDAALKGLYLIVQPSGTKSWALRYRHAGKPRKLTLGKWPVMGLREARLRATAAMEDKEHGKDPAADKKAANALKREIQITERDKIKTIMAQYDQRHLSTLRSGRVVRNELNRHFVALYGETDIHDVKKREIIDLVDDVVDSGREVTANRLLSYIRGFYNWAIGRDITDNNPVAGIKPPTKEKPRDRFLNDDEIRWYWKACSNLGYPIGDFGKVLLLTGQRRNEVARMKENEIDGRNWHLTAQRTKNKKPHDVYLTTSTISILRRNDRPTSAVGFIFTFDGKVPLNSFDKAVKAVRTEMQKIADNEQGKQVEIPHWTFHDMRRTTSTGMARLGIPIHITDAATNHISGSLGGMAAVYQRFDYAPQKKEALEKWSLMVEQILLGEQLQIES